MRKPRIYLDTSAISFVIADDSPDFQGVTIDFFENYASRYDLFVSDMVLLEIENHPDPVARLRLKSVVSENQIATLPRDQDFEVRQLAFRYVEKGVVPPNKMEDALHAAYATVHEMDFLLSWNFKHLANIRKEARFLAVNVEEGYLHSLRLASPMEVLDE